MFIRLILSGVALLGHYCILLVIQRAAIIESLSYSVILCGVALLGHYCIQLVTLLAAYLVIVVFHLNTQVGCLVM